MSKQKLTIVARVTAKEGKEDFVKGELLKLIDPTRMEEGCINYDLHQDNENPNVFVFHENWESRALLQRHMNSDHIAKYLEASDGCVDQFVMHEMTHIG